MNKRIILVMTAVLLSAQLYAGGGWPQKKGEGYFKLSQTSLRSNGFFDPSGNNIDITTVSLYTTSFYGEYGFSDRFTGIIYAPLFVRSTINKVKFNQSGNELPGDELNGIGDWEVGVKYGLVQNDKVAISASILFGLAFGETAGGEGQILQTGDGEYNQLVSIDVSKSFNKTYGTLTVGFNNRTNNFSDELRYGVEFGHGFTSKLNGAVKAFGVKSFFNGDGSTAAGNSIFSNNTEYFVVSPELAYQLNDKWGLAASAAVPLSGKRILSKPSYNLGVYLKL